MALKLKPLESQVMVITGATSGIGLVTARMAAQAGTRLVLTARNREALKELAAELRGEGAEVVYIAADVGREDDVRAVADVAIQHFDGFDTWVNNAAVAIYGHVEEIALSDHRRLFDTNYWGTVHGSRIACEHLREHGGKLINIGSSIGERAIPIQGVYSASKAAVMAFTDALRMELDHERAPVSVSMIKPGAIDTPYSQHAANYLDVTPRNPPPVYAPDTVAKAILYSATRDTRDMVVGSGGKALTTMGNLAPKMSGRIMRRVMPYLQRTHEPRPGIEKRNLYNTGRQELAERGGYKMTRANSIYTAASRHRVITAAAAAAAVGAGAAIYRYRSHRPAAVH